MKNRYTQREIMKALEAVEEEARTGKQTRIDISQTLEQIDIMKEDRYITKQDLEVVQETLHSLEDYLEIVSDYRRGLI